MTRIIAIVLTVAGLIIGAPGIAQAHRTVSHCGGLCGRHNAYRNAHNRPDLMWNKRLHRVALAQAERMADSNTLYHNPNLTTDVTGWQYVGENVGYGPDVPTVWQAFKDSTEHRANILDRDYRQIGVGKVWRNGRVWIAVVFRDPLPGHWRY